MHFFLLVVYAFKDNWIENLWKKIRLLSIAWVVLSALIQPKICSNFHAIQTQKWSDQFGRKLNLKTPTQKKKTKKKTLLNPPSPKNVQHQISPRNINAKSTEKVTRIEKGALGNFYLDIQKNISLLRP